MAAAKKCDKCGKLYEEYDGQNGVAIIHRYNEKDRGGQLSDDFKFCKQYDLCPECLNGFRCWIAVKYDTLTSPRKE